MEKLPCKFGKAKISYFCSPIVQENVGHFQIPMDDIFFCQVEKPRENIFDERLSI